MLIKFIRKTLRPSRKFFAQILIKQCLQCLLVPNLLITCGLIDQRGDAEPLQPFRNDTGAIGNVLLVRLEDTSPFSIDKDVAHLGKQFVSVAESSRALYCAKFNLTRRHF